jgi:hypothetical protein
MGHSIKAKKRKKLNITGHARALILALALAMILISAAYLAAGMLHDRLVNTPESNTPVDVTLVEVDTNELGGTDEHDHLPEVAVANVEYDLGIRINGQKDQSGVRPILTISHANISVYDIEAFYYNRTTQSWWQIDFVDQGNSLMVMLGPTAGYTVDEHFDLTINILITFYIGDRYEVKTSYLLV